MKQRIQRRSLLQWLGAGSAVVALPELAGCTNRAQLIQPASATSAKPAAAPLGATHTTYFDSFGVDSGLLRRVIERGLAKGGDFCEVFLQHKISHWIGMEDDAVNRAYTTVDLGAGIRVLKGDATGFAYCEDLSEHALLSTAATAASVADGPAHATIAAFSARRPTSRYAIDVPWTEIGADKKLPILQRANEKVRAHDSRIIKATIFLSDETSRILVANSDGLLIEDDQPMVVLYVSCVAEHRGKTETSGQSASLREGLKFLDHSQVDRAAKEAASFTVQLFDAVPAPVGELPVVLAPGLSGILLHEAIGHGLEADFNRKGTSIYANRIGQRIAPEFVSIVDGGDGRLRGSINVDDEGADAQQTVLVENGILRSYLHDRISARHYTTATTGSGRRESFRFPTVPRMRNTFMLNGPHNAQEIIGSVKKGLYAEMFANGQVMIGAGDFTFYLKHGRLIEDGKLTHVVKDANLIGNGPRVLEKVSMVANDLAMYSGAGYCGKDGQRVPVGFGLPTIKAGGISIGGRKA